MVVVVMCYQYTGVSLIFNIYESAFGESLQTAVGCEKKHLKNCCVMVTLTPF